MSMSVCLDVCSSYAVMVLAGGMVRQQYDLPSVLTDLFSLCQTHCCLIVTNSSGLLLALRQSEQSHSLCASSIKAHLSERRIRRGVVEQLYLLCSCLQCVYWVSLCASLASREVKGAIRDPEMGGPHYRNSKHGIGMCSLCQKNCDDATTRSEFYFFCSSNVVTGLLHFRCKCRRKCIFMLKDTLSIG